MITNLTKILGLICISLIIQSSYAQVVFQKSADDFPLGVYSRERLKDDFNTTWGNGFKKRNKGEDRVSVVNSPSPEVGRCLQVKYPKGKHDSKESGAQWETNLNNGYDELYLSYDIRFNKGFNLDKNGKLPGLAGGLSFDDSDDANTAWDGKLMWRSGGYLEFYLKQPFSNTKHYKWTKDGIETSVVTDKWYNIEIRYKMNTIGEKDGIMEAWLNGMPVAIYSNCIFRKNANVKIYKMFFSTFFGGNQSDNPNQDCYALFDNFTVSTERIWEGTVDPKPVTGVQVDPESKTLNPGQTLKLKATVLPQNASDKNVEWSSDNPSKVKVSNDGIVEALANGSATITVKTIDGGFTANCKITVEPESITGPTGYTYSCNEGETVKVTGTMDIAYGANGTYKYLYNQKSNVLCNSSAFGDPLPGKEKKCFVKPVSDAGECDFGIPGAPALQSIKTTWDKVYVDGEGADVSNIKKFSINWNKSKKGLYTFAVNTYNGKPAWYLKMHQNQTNTLALAEPTITLSGTGIAALEGTFNVNVKDGDFIMKKSDGSYTLIFSTSTTSPCPKALAPELKLGAGSTAESILESINLYPNPVESGSAVYFSRQFGEDATLQIFSSDGKLQETQSISGSQVELQLSNYRPGVYIAKITSKTHTDRIRFMVK